MNTKPLFQRDFANSRIFGRILDIFREQYQLQAGSRLVLQRRYFDTFDWRLYRNGYVFEADKQEPELGRLRTLGRRCGYLASIIKQDPDFSWNMSAPALREMLEPVIAARRLLPQVEVCVTIEPFTVLDKDNKILLRMELEKYLRPDRAGHNRSVLVNCRFYPLKGYARECRQLLEVIDREISGRIEDPFLSILSRDRITPADYTSKLSIHFEPDMSIGQALAQALLFHFEVMQKNLPGIKAALDTEFLHDFRIANRRSRTLVTQLKHVMPPVQKKSYKEIFYWLSNATSEHRDLDVFLLAIPHFMRLLPASMRGDLEPLRQKLESKRKRVHARLLRTLNSEKFLSFQDGYQAYLSESLDNHFRTATGAQPVTLIASRSIWRVYQKLLKQGEIASRTGDWVALHELRKTGKKLRYLLETFKSLYPEQGIEQVIQPCRKLQNLLGQIVDSRVQQSYLLGHLQESGENPAMPDSVNTCIKHLVETYRKREQKAYGKFGHRFARFSNPATQKQFRMLFRGSRRACG